MRPKIVSASCTVCPVETSIRSQPASAKARAIATESSPVIPPSFQSVAEMRNDIGFWAGPGEGAEPCGRKARPFLERAAILVGAHIGQRRDEARQQIAVRRMHLDHV